MAADSYVSNAIQFGHYNDTDTIYEAVRNVAKQVRDVVNGEWDSFPGSGSLDDYDISAAAASGGLWSGDFPEIANGFYIVQFRVRAGATPDYADTLFDSRKGYWNGSVFAETSVNTDGEVDIGSIALKTTIASVTTPDSVFTLTAGAADDDAYNNMVISIEDVSSGDIRSRRVIDYAQSSKTVTVDYDFEFTIEAGVDIVTIFASSYSQTAGAAASGEIRDLVLNALSASYLAEGSVGQRIHHSGGGRYG